MLNELLHILCCPQSGEPLVLTTDGPEGAESWLQTTIGQHRYPIKSEIPRFVPESNYADNFGMQWNLFRTTQLDSYSGQSISAERFWNATGWHPDELRNKWVLDVGCGAGRFAEVALKAGANVVALDYSSAVDACRENLGHHSRLHIIQGDIYALPFRPGAFDFVYSLGVLQHTPDVSRAFQALPPMLKSKGKLCVDFYESSWKSLVHPKYWLRPFTTRLPKRQLFAALRHSVPPMLALSRAAKSLPLVGGSVSRFIPVVNYYGVYPLTAKQHQEWSLLDTFDWFAPAYDSPQTHQTIKDWLGAAGLQHVEVLKSGHLVGRGIKA